MKPILDRFERGVDWTREEHWRLSTMAKQKMSAAKIAKILCRRVGSIRCEARKLGILLYKK